MKSNLEKRVLGHKLALRRQLGGKIVPPFFKKKNLFQNINWVVGKVFEYFEFVTMPFFVSFN